MVQLLAPTWKKYNKCDKNIKAGEVVRFSRWHIHIFLENYIKTQQRLVECTTSKSFLLS